MKTLFLKEIKKVLACISISVLGMMQEKNEVAQASLGCAYMAGENEGGAILGWNSVVWGMWIGINTCVVIF